MQTSGHRAMQAIGDSAQVPPVGTGPLGLGGDKRWITGFDVVCYNAMHQEPSKRTSFEWRVDGSTPFPLSDDLSTLRDYQKDAVNTANPEPNLFKSGDIEISCGGGKTFVGARLIRNCCFPSVVVTQHNVSVEQWVRHFRTHMHMQGVMTWKDIREWKADQAFPQVTVITYNVLVRAYNALEEHWNHMSAGTCSGDKSSHTYLFLWMLHVRQFGLLILDEVHTAVADQFHTSYACRLKQSAIIGLSGSLVREDDRLQRLNDTIGPLLFRYHTSKNMTYTIAPASLHDDMPLLVLNRRNTFFHTVRALNPNKIFLLHHILNLHATQRKIVFVDSVKAATILYEHLKKTFPLVFLLHGDMADDLRREHLVWFESDPTTILVTTKVSDVAVDFPAGCVVIQFYVFSGSRQQEVQRIGRGSRGNENETNLMYHILNEVEDERSFVDRRLEYVTTLYPPDNFSQWELVIPQEPTDAMREPLLTFVQESTRLTLPRQNHNKRRKKMAKVLNHGHKH